MNGLSVRWLSALRRHVTTVDLMRNIRAWRGRDVYQAQGLGLNVTLYAIQNVHVAAYCAQQLIRLIIQGHPYFVHNCQILPLFYATTNHVKPGYSACYEVKCA